jgi:hypothetical protein
MVAVDRVSEFALEYGPVVLVCESLAGDTVVLVCESLADYAQRGELYALFYEAASLDLY